MLKFVDDDQGYLDWVSRHSDLFVINTYRSPKATYLRLHRASCLTISGAPTNGRHWTKSYVKVCGGRAELEKWAIQTVGGEPWACPACVNAPS
jgi:hypothetical protein